MKLHAWLVACLVAAVPALQAQPARPASAASGVKPMYQFAPESSPKRGLQLQSDRRERATATASGVAKKTNDTASAAAGNVK
jgi:hypothetical protein